MFAVLKHLGSRNIYNKLPESSYRTLQVFQLVNFKFRKAKYVQMVQVLIVSGVVFRMVNDPCASLNYFWLCFLSLPHWVFVFNQLVRSQAIVCNTQRLLGNQTQSCKYKKLLIWFSYTRSLRFIDSLFFNKLIFANIFFLNKLIHLSNLNFVVPVGS